MFASRKDDYTLYILLDPTVNWVDDGTRIMPSQTDRKIFFDNIV